MCNLFDDLWNLEIYSRHKISRFENVFQRNIWKRQGFWINLTYLHVWFYEENRMHTTEISPVLRDMPCLIDYNLTVPSKEMFTFLAKKIYADYIFHSCKLNLCYLRLVKQNFSCKKRPFSCIKYRSPHYKSELNITISAFRRNFT